MFFLNILKHFPFIVIKHKELKEEVHSHLKSLPVKEIKIRLFI